MFGGGFMRLAGLSIALVLSVGCDFTYSKCVDTLGEERCGGTFEPHLGPWEGEPSAWSDGCGAEAFPNDDDWILAAQALTPPDGTSSATCTRTDRTLVCEPVVVEVVVEGEGEEADTTRSVTLTTDGDFVSQSELVGTVTLQTDTCSDDADLQIYASWRDNWANPNPEEQGWFGEWFQNWLPGDGPGYVPGSCPSDWDDHEWADCNSEEWVTVTIVNNDTDFLGLLQRGVFYSTIDAGTSIEANVCPGIPYVLARGGISEEDCLWSFAASPEGGETYTYPDDVED